MVKNKRELLAMADQWMSQAQTDLRNHAIRFMEMTQINVETLADSLGVNINEIGKILHGDGDISLSTFAKILIATDNVIAIQPLSTMKEGRMPNIAAPKANKPARDANGRFAKKNSATSAVYSLPTLEQMPRMAYPSPEEMRKRMGEIPTPEQMQRMGGMPGMAQRMERFHAPKGELRMVDDASLDEMSYEELEHIAITNRWATKRQTNSMSRSELIELIQHNASLNLNIETQHENVKVNDDTVQNHQDSSPNANELGSLLAQALKENPSLMDAIGRYLK